LLTESIEKNVFRLEQDESTIVGEGNLKVFITNYYKNFLGLQVRIIIFMLEQKNNDIPQLTREESEILTAIFTNVEVKEAIMQMERNKAPDPDGLPAEFYQIFWEVIEEDLMAMCAQLRTGELTLFKLNFGFITLLPKK
jgi:hypothetical protein